MLNTWFQAIFRWLVAVSVATTLVACGGGGGEEPPAASPPVQVAAVPSANPFGDFGKAVAVNATLSGTQLDHARAMAETGMRKHALSAGMLAAPAAPLTPDELFNWGQRILPTLFPGNPQTMTGDYGGAIYDFRAYSAPGTKLGFTYLGVRRSDGAVFVLFSNDELRQYAFLQDYLCDVRSCGGGNEPIISGDIKLEINQHTVTPVLIDGKILGTSEGELDPTTLDRVCVEGPNYGFDVSTTCGNFQGGRAIIAGVSNNDRVQYVGRLKASGKRVWFTIDQGATTHFTFSGLNAVYVNGFVEYSEFVQAGQPVYRKPTARVEGGNLVLAFGRNRLSGFGLSSGRTDFTSGNYQFRFQPRSGDVKAMATAVWHDATKELRVVFAAELKCTDTGTITVHRQIVGGGYSTSVAGWLSIGRGTDAEPVDIIWSFTAPGVVPVVDTGAGFYGFRYQRTGC